MEHVTRGQFDDFIRELQSIARIAGEGIKVSTARYPKGHALEGQEYMIGYSVMLRDHREVLAAVHYPYTTNALYTIWPFQAGLYRAAVQGRQKETT